MIDNIDKKCADIKNCRDIQGQDGNWNTNEYMRGMFNGLELAVAILEGKEPAYKDFKTKEHKE